MIEKELEIKAFEYRKELVPYTELGYPDVEIPVYAALDIDRAYITGAKENGIIWHDLRKNPKDLPPKDVGAFSTFVITNKGIGYYVDCQNKWVVYWNVTGSYEDSTEVIAWCELPKFEVEE